MVVGLAFAASSTASSAQAAGRYPGIDPFLFMGFGAAFLDRLNEQGTCRDMEERLAAASGQTGLELFGALAGLWGGALLGEDLFGSRLGGAILGGIVGNKLASEAGRAAAPRAANAARYDSDQFGFQICRMIGASDVLKEPLFARYIQIAEETCAIDPQLIPRMENRDWNALVDCNNGRSEEARQIMLQIIRINQATCFGIDAFGRAITAMPRDRGAPTIEQSIDPECDARSPGAVWQSYLSDRLQ